MHDFKENQSKVEDVRQFLDHASLGLYLKHFINNRYTGFKQLNNLTNNSENPKDAKSKNNFKEDLKIIVLKEYIRCSEFKTQEIKVKMVFT